MAAYTAIDDSSLFFTPVIWTGSGAQQTISVPFQADFIWVKNRGATINHASQDSVIGFGTRLSPNRNVAEGSEPHGIGTVSASGFNFQGTYDGNGYNESSATYVAWCWKESATAGFDIVSYTGNGSARTISHSLSAKPEFFVVKSRTYGQQWECYSKKLGATKCLQWDDDSAEADIANRFNDTEPTTSVFTVGDADAVNKNTYTYITYLWRSVQGFSKMGSYTGNGNADGTFIYTGFRPAYIMIKNASASGNWELFDNKRSTYNLMHATLYADTDGAEYTGTGNQIDVLSNGFKCREADTNTNGSGNTYIYMAFAEAPFVNSNGVPCNAR